MRFSSSAIYNWAIQKINSRRAPLWIGILFLFEILLLIPLDAILMFFCLQNRQRTLIYIGIAALASTLSGVAGYLLGYFLWDLIGPYVVPHLISAITFTHFQAHYQLYQQGAVFIGALLPFPLKAVSLTAGICRLGLPCFFYSLLFGRFFRFVVIGIATYLWGDRIKEFVDRNFKSIALLLGTKIALTIAFFWSLSGYTATM